MKRDMDAGTQRTLIGTGVRDHPDQSTDMRGTLLIKATPETRRKTSPGDDPLRKNDDLYVAS